MTKKIAAPQIPGYSVVVFEWSVREYLIALRNLFNAL
jgi:hypothetical protein